MTRVFQVLSILFAAAAGYFLWAENSDGAFVTAVLGAVSFFLSLRFQTKARVAQLNAEREAAHTSQP